MSERSPDFGPPHVGDGRRKKSCCPRTNRLLPSLVLGSYHDRLTALPSSKRGLRRSTAVTDHPSKPPTPPDLVTDPRTPLSPSSTAAFSARLLVVSSAPPPRCSAMVHNSGGNGKKESRKKTRGYSAGVNGRMRGYAWS